MRQFSVLIKPSSSLCNMRCQYCFYADEVQSRNIKSYGFMSSDTAHALIRRVFEAAGTPSEVNFVFQGGEPTLAGLPFFRDFSLYADTNKPEGSVIHYAIQTNGLLIDTEWASYFKQYNYLVGVSLDATAALHDLYRIDANAKPTYKRILASILLLKHAGVDFNILTVVTAQMAKHPREVFSACFRHGFQYVQFIPCLSPLDDSHEPYSLTPELYASFNKQLFRLWYDSFCSGHYISIRQYDNLVLMMQGCPPEQCGMSGFCSVQYVIEADGSVFPCDFYVLDQYLGGNITTDNFETISASKAVRRFLTHKEPISLLCADCPVKRLCGYGCRRYRSFYRQKPDYCPNQDFLSFALPYLRNMVLRLSQHRNQEEN